ncbi:H/ACA ribonucleoprotein complex subunit 2-like [Stylophora pistillata]|uniref:H/ACA ribonucleoprotein complex subunit 2 n=1 Tax=Stylophora pistillata TaxID=50429 RepID=A0A2B4S1N8_STYPI|nr:H/ACA ribonucleoprotein complex subunit 2-like [Stylophora pistillata]PFX22412.1 H/ACA ribonucleoprotein complex subunit 2-like protein [Stylophora pistillata]
MARSKDKKKDAENGEADDTKDDSRIDEPTVDYEELVKRVCAIAKPLASRKLTKRLYKTVKKASKAKSLRRGVKEVAKALRKGEKGFVVIAGDVSPIDVISHIPVVCEDNKIPYAYVPSRLDLGAASQTKRPTSIVLVKSHEDFKDN